MWTERFKSAGPFAIRTGPLHNRGWQTAISPLVVVEREAYPGPFLIVCASDDEDLVALSRESGEELWRISRLWEYEPGYIPSEYVPYVTRFVWRWIEQIAEGQSELSIGELSDEDWSAVQKYLNRRRRFRREVKARMVAGPVVVPGEGIFMGVERRRRSIDGWGEHPAEGIVYQIDPETGEPEAWVRLPSQLSDEIAPIADDAGSVWFCRDGAVGRLLPRSDLYLPVDWYKSLPSGERPVQEFLGIPTGLHRSVFVRFGMARYVSRGRNQPDTYEQQIEFMNTRDGHGIPGVLVVPLEPRVPSTYGYGSRGAPYDAHAVDLSDDRLELTIRSESDAFSLRFDVSPIVDQLRDR